ncbi:hypothetical protein IW261DRAFT_1562874 [Armillaria novae-zelandiae]|uniref:Mid2 domain-containing protein n=1 Tax=Armillaria novae-zelandiae TaxID=153914 RepID=A0AA39PCA2_9AGAR|nr:hypothetical protein IW261DRAFT_1562874 [Armillaria novae-zelandiae]
MMKLLGLCLVLFYLSLGFIVEAKLVNVTIDDQSAGLVFSPVDAWNNGTACQSCTAHPDASRAFDGTWYDSTFNKDSGSNAYPNQVLNVSMSFTGTAIYVICILANTATSPTGNSDMTFYIDNKFVGEFYQIAPGEPGYQYNVTVYSNNSIPNGLHNFKLQNGHVDGIKALVILDSIIYSYDDGQSDSPNSASGVSNAPPATVTSSSVASSSTTSTSGTNIGSIVGPAVAVPLALIIGVAAFFLLRRRKGRAKPEEDTVEAFVVHGWNPGHVASASTAQSRQPLMGPTHATTPFFVDDARTIMSAPATSSIAGSSQPSSRSMTEWSPYSEAPRGALMHDEAIPSRNMPIPHVTRPCSIINEAPPSYNEAQATVSTSTGSGHSQSSQSEKPSS